MLNALLNVESYKPLSYIQKLIVFFFIYAFFGWLLETIYCVYELGYITKRGFLFGPMCPIYGYGAVMIIVFLKQFKDNNLKLFFASAILFSIFEYLVGYSIEAIFLTNFWNYTNEPFNLNGRITLSFSFVWGIFAIIFINFLHPFVENLINSVSKNIPHLIFSTVINILLVIYVLDTILSFLRYLVFS